MLPPRGGGFVRVGGAAGRSSEAMRRAVVRLRRVSVGFADLVVGLGWVRGVR